MIELLNELNRHHGPAGDEGDISAYIAQQVAPYADDITTDVMGNLIVHKKGEGERVMVCAHMDSIGFVVTHFEKEGFLRVGRLGGITPAEVAYTPVRFKNGVIGTVVKDEKAQFGKLKMDDLVIDIGAKDEAEARGLVQLGDTAVFHVPAKMMNGCKAISPYMDNRISCAILMETLRRMDCPANDMYFVFSTQEEVGLRGATTAAYAIQPSYGIAVDVTTSDDVVGSGHSGTAVLGGGAAIKLMDRSIICHPTMVTQLEKLAQEGGIASQREIMKDGGTDAGAISKSRYGVISGGISIPCRYIHTAAEMVDLGDVEGCIQLLLAVTKNKL